jgi:PilZ domain
LAAPKRQTARIVPPHPITVAIEEDGVSPFAFGAIADISESGACVWTDAELPVGAALSFRISFANPPEVHEVVGVVVWSTVAHGDRQATPRSGVAWVHATWECRRRLLDIAGRAMRPRAAEEYPFQVRWRVLPSHPGV